MQVRQVFRRIGLGWGKFRERDSTREHQEEMRQFFWAYVLLRDSAEDRTEILQQILDEPNGMDALVFSSNHVKGFAELVKSEGKTVNQDFEIIRILGLLLPEELDGFVSTSRSTLNHLDVFNAEFIDGAYALALAETGHVEKAVAAEDDIFTPLS